MRLEKVADPAAGAVLAAEIFIEFSNLNPSAPLGLATGMTMSAVYQNLAASVWRPHCDHAFALDEYLGLPPSHPNSFEFELRSRFVEPLDFAGRLHVPGQGEYRDAVGYQLFEHRLAELGPVQVQLLGLGTNGHVAFNEPGTIGQSITREVELASETIEANSKYFANSLAMPRRAVTQGLATIFRANYLVLVATGASKHSALRLAISEGSIRHPLSALMSHPHLVVISDY